MRFLIMGLAMLAGCASLGTANVDPSYRPGANGLLVASVTASGYNPGTLWYQVVRTNAVTRTVASIPVNDEAYGMDWRAGDPSVPQAGAGRLAVLELAPGEYELRRWVINVGNQAAYSSTRPMGYRFAVEPGKATYLGNVHVDIQRSASAGSGPYAATLEDQRARDLPILYRKFPGVSAQQVLFAKQGAAPEPLGRRPAGPGSTRMDDLQGLLPK